MKANETVSLDFLTPERLSDPAAMQWLLQRLSLTRRMGHESKWKEASDVLSDSALEGWLLSTDERIGTRLAEEIHPSRLVPMTDKLVESWPHLADTTAGELIVQLAKIAPAKATELIARFVREGRKVDANPRTWGVLTAMELLGNRARPQAEVLLRRAASGPIFDVMGMGRLFHAGALLQCAGVIPLLESFLRLRGNREMEAQLALFDTFAGLAPEAPFFEMAVGWIQQRRGTLLRDFPEFFKVNSPLDSLDEVLASRLDDLGPRMDDLIDSLDSGFQQLICQSLVRVGLTESSSHLRRLIRGFVGALAANRCVRSNRPWGGTPFERLVELASLDVAVLPEEKRLVEALVARCTPNCIPALQMGLQDARYSAGLRRLLSVARQVPFSGRLQEVIETLGVDINEEALAEATFALIEGDRKSVV